MRKGETLFQRKFLTSDDCKCKCHSKTSVSHEKWGFEFRRGKAIVFREKKNNEIITSKYTLLNFIPKMMMNVVRRIGNLYFFTISLIMLINNRLSPFEEWIIITLISTTIFVNFGVEFWLDKNRKLNDNLINNQLTARGENDSLNLNCKWKDLEIGNIIYLKKNEVCPADIIILDTSEIIDKEVVCYVDTSKVDGIISFSKKKASHVSQIYNRLPIKNNYKEFRKIMSGKIEYEGPNPDPQQFLGFLRLKKDPKVEKLTFTNFIARGSVLKNTEWIFGLVVFTGYDTKMMLNSNYGRYKISNVESNIQVFFIVLVFIIFFFAVLSSIIMIAKTKELSFLIEYDEYSDSAINFFLYLVLYTPVFPIVIYGNIDCLNTSQKFIIEKRVKEAFPGEIIRLVDPVSFTNIAQIQYVLLDKTGTVTKTNYKISQVFFHNKVYRLDPHKLENKLHSIDKIKFLKTPFINISTNGEVVYVNQTIISTFEKMRNTVILAENSGLMSPENSIRKGSELSRIEETENEQKETIFPEKIKYEEIELSYIEEDELKIDNIKFIPLEKHDQFKRKQFELKNLIDKKDKKTSIYFNEEEISKSAEIFTKFVENKYEDLNQLPAPTIKIEKPDDSSISENRGETSYLLLNNKQNDETNLPSLHLNHKVSNLSYQDSFTAKANDFFYNESQFFTDLTKETPENNLDELFEALTICSSSKLILSDEGKLIYESSVKEEQVVLEFSKLCYFLFDKADSSEDPSQYYMKYKNHKFVYHIYGINEFSYNKKSFSIVYKSPIRDNEVSLLCKGQEDYIRERLSMEKHEEEIFDVVIKEMHNKGLKPIIYAKRTLSPIESVNYVNKIKTLKTNLINQQEKLDELGLEIENNLQLVTIIGLKDEINEGVDDCIKFFKETDINTWMVTGDSKENAIIAASSIKIFDKNDKKREITQNDQENLILTIRNLLNEIKNIYSNPVDDMNSSKTLELNKKKSKSSWVYNVVDEFYPNIERKKNEELHEKKFSELKAKLNKYYLIINGESLEIIMKDSYLKPHFTFIISLINKVIAYNLTPRHKYMLVQTIQESFLDSPNVMAIGDGINDSLMMQGASIGIEIIDKENILKGKSLVNCGDIQLSSLKMLKNLMLFEGTLRISIQQNFIYFMFYKSSLMGLTIFLYNWFCSFTGTSIYHSYFVFLYSFFFSAFNLTLYVLFDQPINLQILRIFPGLYKEAIIKKKHFFLHFLVKSIVEGIIHSFIIFYTTIYIIRESTDDEGYQADYGILSLILIITIVYVHNFKILILCLIHKVRLILITFPISTILFATSIFLGSHTILGRNDWNWQFLRIFRYSGYYLTIFLNIIICLLISFLFETYIQKKMLYFNNEKYNNPAYLMQLNNKQILKEMEIPVQIGNIVKKIFSSSESFDPAIQEMFTPADINVNELEINKYSLKIYDYALEQKFNFSNVKSNMNKAISLYVLSIVLFFIYVIYTLIKNKSKLYGFICLGVFLIMLTLGVLLFTRTYERNYYFYTKFMIFSLILAKMIVDWISNGEDTGLGASVVAHISTMNLNLGFYFTFGVNAIHFLSYFISLICIYYNAYPFIVKPDPTPEKVINVIEIMRFYSIWSLIIFITMITLLSLYSNYKFEKLKRSEYLAKSRLEMEANNIQDILTILVPKFVKDHMTQGERSMQEAQDDVGILFCDMCDFDHIITTENIRIVQILDEIFRNFDNFCLKHGVQKIETVGKTYMACAGLKACETIFSENILKTEKTRRLVSMALEMIKYIEKVTYGKGEQIKLKIGIHIGNVIIGIIGEHKPQFSLIGDTVNTTSRVCSTGEDGSITISEQAYTKIKNSNLEFLKRVVTAKGKGDITTYQVLKQRKKRFSKESKLKKKIILHMSEIKKIYEQENVQNQDENILKSTIPVNKAINLMQTWYTKKKIENKDKLQKNSYVVDLNNEYSNNNMLVSGREEELELDDDDLIIEKEKLTPSNEFFLTFSKTQPMLVEEFQNLLLVNFKVESKVFLGTLFGVSLIQTLIMISISSLIDEPNFVLLFRGTYVLNNFIAFLIISYINKRKLSKIIIFAIYLYGITLCLVQINFTNIKEVEEIGLLEMIFVYLIYANSTLFTFVEVLILTSLAIVAYLIGFLVSNKLSAENFFFILAMFFFNLLKVHFHIRSHIDSFNSISTNEARKESQNKLVSQLLPYHAFEKLKHISVTNKIGLTDFFENVTLLFADIAGFTKYSSSVRPEDVVTMLRGLFIEFDKKCLVHKVYKVYTIGDCYVVMGFLNANQRNPLEEAKNVVLMGLSMIKTIQETRTNLDIKDLDMRIGIHTGEIIGGIIGTDIVRYDIYGRDVLIANKMESNGLEGHIMVSETTKKLLEKDENCLYKFVKRKDVECKVIPEPITGYLIYEKEKFKSFYNQ